MTYRLEITEGHDGGACFWIYPVVVHKKYNIGSEDVEKLPEEISLDEDHFVHFLEYFFLKYFDAELPFNKWRIEYRIDGEEYAYVEGFEWYLEHNFYTYDSIGKMLDEIEKTANLLESDYDNEYLKPIVEKLVERYSINYMVEYDSEDYHVNKNDQPQAIKKNIHVVVDFYRRFVERINKMMEHNRGTNVICIMGP